MKNSTGNQPQASSFAASALCVGLCLIIFAAEQVTQLGFAHGFLYVPVLLICERHNSIRRMRALCLFVIVLIIGGYFISPPPPPGFSSSFILLNRVGAIVALLTILWLSANYRNRFDIQASTLAQEQRKQDEFQALVESLPVQIWTATPAGEINYVGQKLEQFAGKPRAEIVADWLSVLHPDDRDPTVAVWMDSVTHNKPYHVEFRLRAANGDYVWHLTSAVPELDAQGNTVRWLGSSIDIDAIKSLQREAQVAQERFHLIGLATNDAIWDWDFTTNLVWWNSGFFKMFGYQPEDIEPGPESWTNRIHPDDLAAVSDSIHQFIDNPNATHWQRDYRFIHKSGRTVYVSDRGVAVRDEAGTVLRMIGSMIDVTDKRQRDEKLQQSQKLEAIGQLTGGIAHDFNNLLTVIVGNSEALVERANALPEIKNSADMILTAALKGAELTNRLLSFARKQALMPTLIDANKLVTQFEPLITRTLQASIDIEVIKSGGLWKLEADPHQLESALLNLCINARDAMPNGGRITIETANTWLDDSYAAINSEVVSGQYVMISVSDTGTGMTPEVVKSAFDPFFTTKAMGKGTGLGLSMVYGFVKQSGGHIKIYSELNEGTTIKMYFPRVVAATTELFDSPPLADSIPDTTNSARILAVEDDDLVRQNLVLQLNRLGYQCDAVSSGEAALQVLGTDKRYDLLFTDVVMPGGMNGRQLADRALASRPELKVLFTSGYTENAIVHHGRLDAGVHLISKPYRLHELAAKLRKVLGDD